jgi:hypothetical protein
VSSLFGKPHYPRLIHKLHAVGGCLYIDDKEVGFVKIRIKLFAE